jgi:ribose/xylose/arabinose/galactoside ABC-type transport system permease subunit
MTSTGTPASLAAGSMRLRHFALRYGFHVVILAIFVFFSLATQHFHEIGNLISLVHAMSPLMVIASGLALVVIGVNPLIATLGTMIAFRGAALQLTAARTIDLPDGILQVNDLSIASIPIDVFLALAIVIAMHLVHRSTTFGRHITAIGNGTELAQRIGLPVRRLIFRNFVLCGLLASVGGLMSTLQIGSVTAYMGIGLEFNAVAAVVVGGISLFGGRGSILQGVILGALAFEMIRNGLNHLGANPYAYRLVSGTVIFIAMYADALKPSLKKAGSILERT